MDHAIEQRGRDVAHRQPLGQPRFHGDRVFPTSHQWQSELFFLLSEKRFFFKADKVQPAPVAGEANDNEVFT
jgi:hypothetical protein